MIRYFVAHGETQPLNETARAGLRGSFLRLSDGITHYELAGPDKGELVLLVPGLTIPLFYWDRLADQLHAQGMRTLAYSAYGRGYSDRVETTYDRALFVRQAHELIQRLELSEVSHVIGTSMGALISMALVQEQWFRTRSLTLIGPAGLESRLPLAARLSRWRGSVAQLFGRYLGRRGVLAHLDHNVRSKERARMLKAMVGDAYRYNGSVYALFSTLQSFPLIDQHELYRRTGDLNIPTMLIWGQEDRVTPIERMGAVQALLRPTECHVIPMCGHMAPFECPDKVATLFANFLSRLGDRPSTSSAGASITASRANEEHTDVVIVGAGPTGLTLACDLARRGVNFKIVDRVEEPFRGSRGKGVQPRTLEVFDDLGVVQEILEAGGRYPPMSAHLSFLKLKWYMVKPRRATPDVPYPTIWLVPQWRTEEVLRNRLSRLGHRIEWGTEAVGIEQDHGNVAVQVGRGGMVRSVRARYAVGTDGGRSFVRKALGVEFIGSTSQEWRMIVGDLRVDGLSRDSWHVWPATKGLLIGLCPLPHSDLFQMMMKLDASEGDDPDLSEQAIQARWLAATGLKKIRLHDPTWMSLFRPNVRLVERYRVGRTFLAGDAAHVHSPTGAQGLNTGIQDAYNLGWKLALALNGAPDALLDTYQEERMPVAAGVLKLSTVLSRGVTGKGLPKLTRGDEERQLLLNYRYSSLSVEAGASYRGKLRAGDRAPDAPCSRQLSERTRLFDLFRGTHFTLLAFGSKAIEAVRNLELPYGNLVRGVAILPAHDDTYCEALVDDNRYIRRAYGIDDEDNVTFLVRPDGYVGHVARIGWKQAIEEYLAAVVGVHSEREPLGAARIIVTDQVDTPSRTRS